MQQSYFSSSATLLGAGIGASLVLLAAGGAASADCTDDLVPGFDAMARIRRIVRSSQRIGWRQGTRRSAGSPLDHGKALRCCTSRRRGPYGHAACNREDSTLRKSSTLGEARMSVRIATTLVLAIAAVTAAARADAGSCGPKYPYQCTNNTGQNIDLNSVSDIASKIVSEQPVTQSQKKTVNEPAVAAPYSGPIVGVTSGKRAPTVGYSWSLE